MSLLGTLEQFSLPNVLQRIEAHEKTGLLVVRQGAQWVEFYLRDGRLLCIGPVRTSASLGERLVQDKIITPQVWQEVKRALASDEQSETRVAITLMERGYISREKLRSWTIEKSLIVLRAILAWAAGDVYFEENTQPPSDRLLVSMSVTSLIETAHVNSPSPQPQVQQITPATYSTVKFNRAQEPASFETPPSQVIVPSIPASSTPTPTPQSSSTNTRTPVAPVKPQTDITRVPTLMNAAEFLEEKVFDQVKPSNTVALPETESFASFLGGDDDSPINASSPNTNEISFASLTSIDSFAAASSSIQPERVMYPMTPKRIDTSFMKPDMVLVPADISAFRERNPKIQITPDQWRILTCVDGHNSLQMACQLLAITPDLMCVLAGELVAEGLIYVVPPEQVQMQGTGFNTRDLAAPGLAPGYVAPGYTANAATPWSAAVPASADVMPNPYAPLPFETESQWGNGGNGATFIPGRGWITTPQPMLPLHSNGPLAASGDVYAQVGGSRY